MNKKILFIVKLAVFFFSFVWLIFCKAMPQYSTSYNAAINDKYARLKNINEPKIILVGDSNIAFGFDSKMVQDAFDMPVVNFGLHGGLGQAFHTNTIKKYIREGDIVVIAPAGYQSNGNDYDYVLAWMTIENNIKLLIDSSAGHYLDMFKAFPTYLRKLLHLFIRGTENAMLNDQYDRLMFNEFGDNIYPRPECIIVGDKYDSFYASDSLSKEMRDYWNDYNKYIISKKAHLFMSCPPILQETLTVDLCDMQKQLENELEFPVIAELENYIYPLELFFDTGFHLNDHGKILRTEQFINDLKSILDID